MRPGSPRLAWILPAILLASAAVAGEVGFVEDFALARDRSAALRQLIPGTEDYYFYHALHALQTEQYDQAVGRTKPWLERFGQTPRLTEIQTRHALLTYDRDPQKTLAYLRMTNKRLTLLINFNVKVLRDGIQRIVL